MSLTAIRPYFQNKIKGLGYKEHLDVFNIENIANTNADYSFHVTLSVSGEELGQYGQQINTEVTLRLFLKGYRDMSKAYDDAIRRGQGSILEVMNAQDRMSANIKNIIFNGMTFEQYATTNDNIIIAVQNYNVVTYLCY